MVIRALELRPDLEMTDRALLVISATVRAASLSPPLSWTLWQVVHATASLAWLLCRRPTWVGWLRWQLRQTRSVAAGVSFAGLRMAVASA